ncbi:microfibril-associated glycoprotein 4-like [Acropora muricata]|uniref:microfibril-associated glycoprotein 4-like n=1 Tax=Acropora muricata TaxID=159855 RepID=UPI0034E4C65E
MRFQLALFLLAILVQSFANTLANPKKRLNASTKPSCTVNNNYNNFYSGQLYFKKIEQQLNEIKEAIVLLKRNETSGSGEKAYKDCAEVYKSGKKISGVYKIDPDGLGDFDVYCDHKTAGGGWTVFQKRRDGSIDFYRNWDAYKRGFGNVNGEFWLGLDKIHRLTVSGNTKLHVDLEDIHGSTAFAEYNSFTVASERAKYQLSLGRYSGTAGDALSYHRGQTFSTKDRNNDLYSANCAVTYTGAWWYKNCYECNLNGRYLNGKISYQGMSWKQWKSSHFSVKRSEMKIRPPNF